MSKSRLFSGKIKKLSGDKLTVDRYDYLDISQAEPDLGLPQIDGSILVGTTSGVRTWLTTLTNIALITPTITSATFTGTVVGDLVVKLLRGGVSVGQSTLTRFYSAHTFVLPVVAAVLMLTHFVMIRKQGISGPL
jgi:hypothetical protein